MHGAYAERRKYPGVLVGFWAFGRSMSLIWSGEGWHCNRRGGCTYTYWLSRALHIEQLHTLAQSGVSGDSSSVLQLFVNAPCPRGVIMPWKDGHGGSCSSVKIAKRNNRGSIYVSLAVLLSTYHEEANPGLSLRQAVVACGPNNRDSSTNNT